MISVQGDCTFFIVARRKEATEHLQPCAVPQNQLHAGAKHWPGVFRRPVKNVNALCYQYGAQCAKHKGFNSQHVHKFVH
jgi:hypothetical protein